MQQIGHHPNFGRSPVDLVNRDRGRTRASAAAVRRASAQGRLVGAEADAITVWQHIARWSIAVVAIVLASALYALQIHAMLR